MNNDRTVADVLADFRSAFAGRTRYEGQAPRDDELLVAEIDRLRKELLTVRILLRKAMLDHLADLEGHEEREPDPWAREALVLLGDGE